MHEWSIADNLVKLIMAAAEREGLVTVSRVAIRVGVLRQVIPESLEIAFSCITRETPISGAGLEIEVVPLKVCCRNCGTEFSGNNFVFACSNCGGTDLNIIAGKELYIDFIEGEKNGNNML